MKKVTTKKSEPKVPTDLRKALTSTPQVVIAWKDLTPVARRDFITWIKGAKQPETRTRRIGITCDKLASGKRRPCCYAVVPMNLYKALGTNPKAKATWSSLSPVERRDLVGWIDEAGDTKDRTLRIEKVCIKLATGSRR